MKVLFAPHEICGQMRLLAEAFGARGIHARSVAYEAPDARGYRNDLNFDFTASHSKFHRLRKMAAFFARAAREYDVFHFFYGRSLLPRWVDLPLLRRMGKLVFVHFRGSDIRQRKHLTQVAARTLRGDLLDDVGQSSAVPPSSNAQKRCITVWRKHAHRLFVSIPELLEIVPDAEVVQQAIDLKQWEYHHEEHLQHGDIVVAHAPSDRGYKGTSYVIGAVERLRSAGLPVRLQLIEGVPHTEVKRLYAECHLGVDELLQGSYGNVSIELMAMGKPVVANLGAWYAKHRPDLPILHATPSTLEDVLRELILTTDLRRRLGAEGRRYVERWHSSDSLAARLLSIYTSYSGTAVA